MKYILAILVIIGSAFAQNTTYKDGTECKCDSIHIEYAVDMVTFTEDSSKILWETPYKNGVINGLYKRYYDTGELVEICTYINGKLNGLSIHYNKQLQPIWKTTYKNNKLNGDWIQFYKSGQIGLVIPFINGKKHGTIRWYFENGKIAGVAVYKNGELIDNTKCSDGRFGNETLDCLN